MSVLPGNPDVLSDRAANLVASADVILSVIEQLRAISSNDEGKSVRALDEKNAQVSGELERIHPRYQGTAVAVTEYAVALSDAHTLAHDAQASLDTAHAQHGIAVQGVRDARSAADGAEDPSPYLTDQLSAARRRAAEAQDDVDAAEARIEQARRDMNDAAEVAIRRIDSAIDATNESWLNKVGEFFSDIGAALGELFKWIGDFLEDVVNFLQKIAATIVAILEALVILVFLVLVGALFGTIGLWIAAIVVVAFAAFLIWSIASDVLKSTPAVSVTDPYPDPRKRPNDPRLETVLDGTVEVDALGGETSSVVKVTKVLGPDGWYCTVTLPSTQEWLSRLGDQGAVNDLDSNLALMLTPALQTQYERAVLQAMQNAGISEDDPVMLVGFSQGGILAAHLAAYNSDYNWQAVVVSGAPIDHMPIPDAIDVVSVQHTGDPVHQLDNFVSSNGAPNHGPHWSTISVDPPNPNSVLGVDVGAHNARDYSVTLQNNLDQVRADHPGLGNFFNNDGLVDVSYYQWTE